MEDANRKSIRDLVSYIQDSNATEAYLITVAVASRDTLLWKSNQILYRAWLEKTIEDWFNESGREIERQTWPSNADREEVVRRIWEAIAEVENGI